jgi:hypothetical protein
MGDDKSLQNDNLKLHLKKVKKISLTDTDGLNVLTTDNNSRKSSDSENLRKASVSDNSRKKSDSENVNLNCVNNGNESSTEDNDRGSLNCHSESNVSKNVSINLSSSLESDDEQNTSSEISDISLRIEEPSDQSNPEINTNNLSRDFNGVHVSLNNNNKQSKNGEDALTPPVKNKKNCKLHKSESFGPIKLRKTGGEILLSRYHKVIQFLPQICTPLNRGIPRNLIFILLYIGIPINLVYTSAQGYPWKSGLHCCTGISLEILFTLLYMDILGNLVYTAVQGYPWKSCLHCCTGISLEILFTLL